MTHSLISAIIKTVKEKQEKPQTGSRSGGKKMTGEERIKQLVEKGWKVVKDETTWCRYVELENEVARKSRDPFGNSTGEDWMQTIHRQVTIYNGGDWEETRG